MDYNWDADESEYIGMGQNTNTCLGQPGYADG